MMIAKPWYFKCLPIANALVNFKSHSQASPHPRWGFDINTFLHPGAVDIEVEILSNFLAVVFKGIELYLLLFNVITT